MQSRLATSTTRATARLIIQGSWGRPASTQMEFRGDLKDISCEGIDGWSSPSSSNERNREEMDDKEYFKHHKPSPLSEVEFVDSRKPITRATDGGAGAYGKGGGDVLKWREDQLETAEETLMRAAKVWKEAVAIGLPQFPHSRALREALRARGDYSLDYLDQERELI